MRLAALCLLLAGCTASASVVTTSAPPDPTTPVPTHSTTTAATNSSPTTTGSSSTTARSPTTTTSNSPATTSSTTSSQPLPPGVIPPPDWLGTRPLPLDADGNPLAQTTPPILQDRRFTTIDDLTPPTDGRFHSTIDPVPPEVLRRSTWTPACPVTAEELTYVTVSFWGFDGLAHTGELIVNSEVATDIVSAFSRLFEAGFPIERMSITTPADLDAEPTGDGNDTSAFACRPVTGGTGWSRHAYGLAIDINPFHNPYLKDGLVLPELAAVYADRDRLLPGMIVEGDAVTEAFGAIGWEWGGRWTSLKDYQHFSADGR